MKTIKPIITILSISLLALVLTACQPTAIEEKPSADDSNIFPKEQAACIYKDGSCCRGEEQEICQIAQVDCEEGKEPVIKGCDEKCEAVVECVVSGESEANTSADDISDSDEVPPAPACQNLCGNSVCEEIVCLAVGCPCAETAESCSQDCIENDEIVDPTANWQTYTNKTVSGFGINGFQFKYPSDWQIIEGESRGRNSEIILKNPKSEAPGIPGTTMIIAWGVNYGSTLDELLQGMSVGQSDSVVEKVGYITIADLQAAQLNNKEPYPADDRVWQYIFTTSVDHKEGWDFSFFPMTDLSQETIDNILASFNLTP